jgi:hypothetical protein
MVGSFICGNLKKKLMITGFYADCRRIGFIVQGQLPNTHIFLNSRKLKQMFTLGMWVVTKRWWVECQVTTWHREVNLFLIMKKYVIRDEALSYGSRGGLFLKLVCRTIQVIFRKMNAVRGCFESSGNVLSHCGCTVVCIFLPCDKDLSVSSLYRSWGHIRTNILHVLVFSNKYEN